MSMHNIKNATTEIVDLELIISSQNHRNQGKGTMVIGYYSTIIFKKK
jgi:hypothetical protein